MARPVKDVPGTVVPATGRSDVHPVLGGHVIGQGVPKDPAGSGRVQTAACPAASAPRTAACLPLQHEKSPRETEHHDTMHKARGAIAPGASMVWRCGSVVPGTMSEPCPRPALAAFLAGHRGAGASYR